MSEGQRFEERDGETVFVDPKWESAPEKPERPPYVIHTDDYEEALRDPKVRERLERVEEIAKQRGIELPRKRASDEGSEPITTEHIIDGLNWSGGMHG